MSKFPVAVRKPCCSLTASAAIRICGGLSLPAFEEDYKVILFDYVGAGKSDLSSYNPEQYKDLEGYSQDILEICDALDLKDVIFIGHWVSSVIGALASIRRPELFKICIMVVPSPCYINQPPDYIGGFEQSDIEGLLDLMDKNHIGWANFLAPVIMKNPERPELEQELEEVLFNRSENRAGICKSYLLF